MSDRLRILVSAYACEPDKGSEPGAGYAWALAASQGHEVTVVTRSNNLPSLESSGAHNIRFEGFDLPAPLLKLKRRLGTQAYYVLWQLAVRKRLRALHQELDFDVVHHLTFASDWAPAAALYVDSPVRVLGPVGGSAPWPGTSARWLGWRGVMGEIRRQATTRTLRNLTGRTNASRATLILAQNENVAEAFDKWPVIVHPNVVIPADLQRGTASPGLPWRTEATRFALSAGRLEPLKAHRLAIAALSKLADPSWHLVFAGQGPEEAALTKYANRRGVEDRVHFLGHVERGTLMFLMSEADVVLSTCMREAGGFAVAEAAAVGARIAYVASGGPTGILTGHDAAVGAPISRNLLIDFTTAWAKAAEMPRTSSEKWGPERLATLLQAAYAGSPPSGLGDWNVAQDAHK